MPVSQGLPFFLYECLSGRSFSLLVKDERRKRGRTKWTPQRSLQGCTRMSPQYIIVMQSCETSLSLQVWYPNSGGIWWTLWSKKKPGDFRPSKMRTIQMMNPELQANNKKMGTQAMRFAEKHHLIPPGQCGARKQHQAKDLALSKRLVWDLLILQRRAAENKHCRYI